jgi:hypothetical protein
VKQWRLILVIFFGCNLAASFDAQARLQHLVFLCPGTEKTPSHIIQTLWILCFIRPRPLHRWPQNIWFSNLDLKLTPHSLQQIVNRFDLN